MPGKVDDETPGAMYLLGGGKEIGYQLTIASLKHLPAPNKFPVEVHEFDWHKSQTKTFHTH